MNNSHIKLVLLALVTSGNACRFDDNMQNVDSFEGIVSHLQEMGIKFHVGPSERDPRARYERDVSFAPRYFLKPGSKADALTMISWLEKG